VLPLSSTFFQQKSLAVAAGLPSTKADDLVTDKALTEQGMMTQQQLAAKWGQQELELLGLTGSSADGDQAAPENAEPDGTSAIAGAAAAAATSSGGDAGGLADGCADAASLGAAVAGGLMEAGDDETAAGGAEEMLQAWLACVIAAVLVDQWLGMDFEVTGGQGAAVHPCGTTFNRLLVDVLSFGAASPAPSLYTCTHINAHSLQAAPYC
jgi:hypothetical protein